MRSPTASASASVSASAPGGDTTKRTRMTRRKKTGKQVGSEEGKGRAGVGGLERLATLLERQQSDGREGEEVRFLSHSQNTSAPPFP